MERQRKGHAATTGAQPAAARARSRNNGGNEWERRRVAGDKQDKAREENEWLQKGMRGSGAVRKRAGDGS